jgi:hypothetical protein
VSILDNTVSNTFHNSIYVIFSALNNSDNLGNSLTVSRNNVNTTAGNSGGDSASAIEIETAFGGTPSDVAATIMLEDNIAVNNDTSGLGDTIEIVNRGDVVGATGTLNVTAWGNTATNNAGAAESAFEVRNFASAGGTLTMTLDLNAANIAANRNNFSSGEANITNDAGATTYNIEGMGLGAQSAANVDTFLSARNDGTITVSGSFVGVANAPPLLFEPAAEASRGMPSVATAGSTDAHLLSQADLDSLVGAAIQRWVETGLTEAQSAMLRRLRFEVADLPGSYLAETDAVLIRVDRNASGNSWLIAAAADESASHGRVDLLTAILHEIGHVLGLDDTYNPAHRNDIMYGFLTTGERRVPVAGQAGAARRDPR